jgi:hypothetical protein
LANWIKDNERGLDMIVEASRKPNFYAPSPSLLDEDHDHGSLMAILQHGLQEALGATRCLLMRAMWHTGEGRIEEAWTDLSAAFRLAQLIEQDPTSVGKLVASSNFGLALFASRGLLNADSISTAQARKILRDLTALRPPGGTSNVIDFDRLTMIDIVVGLAENPENIDSLSPLVDDSMVSLLRRTRVDWNAALMEVNKWYDKAVTADRISDPILRKQALEQCDHDIEQAKAKSDALPWAAMAISPQTKGQSLARQLLPIFLRSLSVASLVDSQARRAKQLDVLRVAAALTVYRSETGNYPNKLADLIPTVLEILPTDVRGNELVPFVYTRNSDGYFLYSRGANGIDDGGSHAELGFFEGRVLVDTDEKDAAAFRAKVPPGADDLPIRMPVRPFKMPAPPVAK